MDSGQRGKTLNARDLTEEIDRATDVAMGLSVGERQGADGALGWDRGSAEMVSVSEMSDERAQALRRGAIFSRGEVGVLANGKSETPEEVAFGQIDNTGEASVKTAAELSEVVGNVANPEASVGVLSEVEQREFEQRDIETAENEADPERSWTAEIEYKSQEAVARDVAPKVGEFLHGRNPELSGLADLYRTGRNKTLNIVGHPIGKDN